MEVFTSGEMVPGNISLSSLPTITIAEDSDPGKGWGVGGIENNPWLRAIYGIIAVLGISGNLLTCFVLLRIRELRTRTSYFIIHLAVADFITSVWVIPFHLFPITPNIPSGILGEIICRVYLSKFLLWVTIFCSIYSLLAVTMERFVAIVHPLRYKAFFTRGNCVISMGFCWVIGVLSNAYFLFNYHVSNGDCVFKPWPNRAYDIVIGFYTLCLVYVIPLTTMLAAHYKMISRLRAQARTLKTRSHEHTDAVRRETRKEAWQLKASQELVKTLLIVVITYALCWAPNQLIFFAYNMGAPVDFSHPYYHISVICAVCNSCVNPFIYGFKNRPFRRGLKQAVCCQNERVAPSFQDSSITAPK